MVPPLSVPPGVLAVLIDLAAGANDDSNYQKRDNCVEHLVIIMMIMMTTMILTIMMTMSIMIFIQRKNLK